MLPETEEAKKYHRSVHAGDTCRFDPGCFLKDTLIKIEIASRLATQNRILDRLHEVEGFYPRDSVGAYLSKPEIERIVLDEED